MPEAALTPSQRPLHADPSVAHDALRVAIEQHGVRTHDYCLDELPWRPFIGPRCAIRSCELVYRRPEPRLLLIVLYRRIERTESLRNPFADLIWFLLQATRREFGIRRIMGFIDRDPAMPDGLSNQRLTRFYTRFFNARHTRYDGADWLYRDVDDALLERLAGIRHLATHQPGDGRKQHTSSSSAPQPNLIRNPIDPPSRKQT
jgi:type III secretion system regulator LcrR